MAIVIKELTKRFGPEGPPALDALSYELPEGEVVGIVGPDGAGKTTLIRLMAGLLDPDGGSCTFFGIDTSCEQSKLHEIIGYMPQRFGLYEDLSVKQNLHLYSKLQGIDVDPARLEHLLAFASLTGFEESLARNLSGGMKQKLGLICSFLKRPKALLLDEPSVGVDPLSRKELWNMVETLKAQNTTIVWSTSYLDEAERCDRVLLLNQGKLLFAGPPGDLTAKLQNTTFLIRGDNKRQVLEKVLAEPNVLDAIIQGNAIRVVLKEGSQMEPLSKFGTATPVAPNFEDAFITLLGGAHRPHKIQLRQKPEAEEKKAIAAVDLCKDFGNFRALDEVSFEVKQGEIFGLIGPNGAGKSTTFKILLGLIKATSGEAYVADLRMQQAPGLARARIGYMAQKFSLYDNMTLEQNLNFFSGVYLGKRKERESAVLRMVQGFELSPYLQDLTRGLPYGIKQRLALSCGLMHEPDVLFLDEPTSGVDPLTRREFWYHINALADQGVTVLVSTHFMEEAEYCDRIGLIHTGRLRVLDTAENIKRSVATEEKPNPTLEDAFITLCSNKGDA